MRAPGALGAAALVAGTLAVAGCGGGSGAKPAASGPTVRFAQIQGLFTKYGCIGCHPAVNPALDLRPGKSYASLVGVHAVEDPRLVRVVAGDPARSFLYQKVAGDPRLGDIPAIGSRMPQGQDRIPQADIDLLRDWIAQGAKNDRGKTVGPSVPSPGEPGPSPVGTPASAIRGTATIRGTVSDQGHRPVSGAIVTLLLRGDDQEGGEEHYRAAFTDGSGRFTLTHAPTGQYLLKAYAPRTIYVSRIVALKDGQSSTVDFGLPNRPIPTPVISRPRVLHSGSVTRFSVRQSGSGLDPNYTIAVSRSSGRVVELRGPTEGPAVFRRTIGRRLAGPWVFLAVDHACNISDFIAVTG